MLELRLLGRLEVRLDDAVVLVPSRPAQSLLAYLALSAGTGHRREKLAGLLWPEADEDNARSNLRHALWRIRKALEPKDLVTPYLLTDDFAVSFNAGADYWLDTVVLARETDGLRDQVETLARILWRAASWLLRRLGDARARAPRGDVPAQDAAGDRAVGRRATLASRARLGGTLGCPGTRA
jgi:DNA-binding SARP family transcriptional activator